jgi:PAS domain S-box-containing protein
MCLVLEWLSKSALGGSLLNVQADNKAAATPGLASARELAAALSMLPHPVFIMKAVRDPDGTVVELQYVFLNQACPQLLCQPVEALVGRGLSEMFPSVRALGIFDKFVQVISSASPMSFDVSRFAENDKEGSFRLTASRFDGLLLVSASDITDVMRARQEAEADRAALRATMDSLQDPHVRFETIRDQTGQIVDFVFADANPAACAYHGIDYEDLVGTRMLDRYPGVGGTGLLDQCAHVVQTGEPLVLDDAVYRIETMGGQDRHLDIRAARVGDGLSYTWRDVTDRHREAERLTESEEQYRLLAQNASDVVMRLSPDRRYEWLSGSIAAVLGWTATDLLGHVIDEFIHPDDLPPFLRVVADTGRKSAASTDFRFRRSDGTYRWVACHTRLKFDKDGTPVALVGGLVDIEDRKQVETQELDRLEELERFQRLSVGRELKMIELKKEIEDLKRSLPANGNDPGPH